MTDLPRTTFDLAGLQSSLCKIRKSFLCKQWHRNRHGDREASPASFLSDPDVSNYGHSWAVPYITAAMLRTNSVPWHVSPAQPAILPFVTNIWAGVQDLSLHSVTPCDDVDSIHCMLWLDEDGDQVDERVLLRCVECRGSSHLACTEEWLEKRDTGCGTSCCIWQVQRSLEYFDLVMLTRVVEPRLPWTPFTARRGTPHREPQDALKRPSRRFITTELSTRAPRSH
jgi:hypothetical protein